jgi:glyoxylase-like metal-dependent hydrolase (beta-lactamase superfamily II)
MPGFMRLCVWDVEHGACVMIQHVMPAPGGIVAGRLAMIDAGNSGQWRPSTYIRNIGRNTLDYLFITNADQDHMSDLQGLQDAGIAVKTLFRNPSYTSERPDSPNQAW